MQNMVEIISEATRWQLDEKLLHTSKAIPCENASRRVDLRPRIYEYGDESDVHTDFFVENKHDSDYENAPEGDTESVEYVEF